ELGAEARRALDHARDAAIDRVEHRGEHDRAERQLVTLLECKTNAGQAGAQCEQRDDVGHERADRNLAQPLDAALAAFRIETGVRHAAQYNGSRRAPPLAAHERLTRSTRFSGSGGPSRAAPPAAGCA